MSLLFAPIREMSRGCFFGAGCLIGLIIALILIGLFFGLVSGDWIGNLAGR